jgi:hypothetical protein
MAPYDPPNAFYTEVRIPYYVDMFKMMGRQGKHLKYITEKSGCQYIWADLNRRVIEIWGREKYLKNGIAMTRNRISRLTKLETPWELKNIPLDARERITARTWESGYQVYYEVDGPESYTKIFFEELCRLYPFNPYMTQINKKTDTGMIISRFSSCD